MKKAYFGLKTVSFVFLLGLWLGSLSARAAQTCSSIWWTSGLESDLILNPPQTAYVGFIVPNETQPRLLRAALSASQTGVYLSVGTERGFMSSAMTQGKTKALVLIDRDANVVTFNQINRALLALSTSRADYLDLRLKAEPQAWSRRAAELVSKAKVQLSPEDMATLKNPLMWKWWNKNVRNLEAWEAFHRDSSSQKDEAFSEVNYLFNDQLYANVATLAKSGRIFVYHENLGAHDLVARLQDLTSQLRLQISVVDLSNSWQEGYMGHERTLQFLSSLEKLQSADSKLVLSFMKNRSPRATQSEFAYSVLALKESLSSPGLLLHHMGSLARQEPSQTSSSYRGRHSRFDYSDGF